MNKYAIEIISERRYGEPKLQTPKALKGIPKAGTVPFGVKRCPCPVYVTEDSIYLKHRDWFSPCISFAKAEAAGIIDHRKSKFIYNDNFGGVVLRCEAWLRIPLRLIKSRRGLLPQYGLCMELERTLGMEENSLCHADWTIMFEELIKLCKPYLPQRPKLETYFSLLDFHLTTALNQ